MAINLSTPGNTSRGVIHATPQTELGPDSFMPEFIARAMEPYIQRKQQESMVRGYMDQKRNGVKVELVNPDNPISKVFGPTGYEQGASFYMAQEKVSDALLGFQNRIDDLKRLAPEDLNKEVMATIDGLKTGNSFADGLIQKTMMDKLGDVTRNIETARISWLQGEAKKSQVASIIKAGSELQSNMITLHTSGLKPEEIASKGQTARANFLGLIGVKPAGQLDESYQDGVNDAARGLIEAGNFYAYQEIRPHLPGLLGTDKSDKLDNLFQMREAKAIRDAALSPDIVEKLGGLDTKIALAELGDKNPISQMEVAQALVEVNSVLKQRTGATADMFDINDIRSGMKSVLTSKVEYEKRLLNQAWQAAERRADAADKLALKQMEAQLLRSNSEMAFSMGGITAAVGRGEADRSVIDGIATTDVQQGRFDRIIGRYEGSDRQVFQGASNALRAPWSAALGKGYTDSLDGAIETFKKINQASVGTAVAYYTPKDYADISAMVRLVDSGVSKMAAWEHVFGESKTGKPTELTYDDRRALTKDNGKVLRQAIDKADPGGILSGRPKWNESARSVLTDAVTNHVALLRKNSSLSLDSAVSSSVNAVIASGEVGVAGPFAWRQAPGTKPLAEVAGMAPEIFDKAFTDIADDRLKAAGYKAGAKGNDYSVHRTPYRGQEQITIFAMEDGKEHVATFTIGDLKARATATAKGKIVGEQIQRSIIHGIR